MDNHNLSNYENNNFLATNLDKNLFKNFLQAQSPLNNTINISNPFNTNMNIFHNNNMPLYYNPNYHINNNNSINQLLIQQLLSQILNNSNSNYNNNSNNNHILNKNDGSFSLQDGNLQNLQNFQKIIKKPNIIEEEIRVENNNNKGKIKSKNKRHRNIIRNKKKVTECPHKEKKHYAKVRIL
jgi:hypothetical protein